MKILLIGNGAREHVMCETLKKSQHNPDVYVYGKAKNPGIMELASGYEVGDFKDFDHIAEFAKSVQPDFAIVSPDDQLADGVGDLLEGLGIKCASPTKTTSQIEWSKSFGRDLLKKYNIPGNPKFRVFRDADGIKEYMENELGGEYVVKFDGLKGGKGVKLSGEHLETIEDGYSFAVECLEGSEKVVVEEKFVGVEFSLLCFSDGETVVPMPVVQDHKRAYDGDTGPNTGGMGSYSYADHSMPFLKPSDVEDALGITKQVAKAIKEETGEYFKGVMYGGWIAVKDGVRLIEYNARFGDPEAMNLLPILETDYVDICQAIINRDLGNLDVKFLNKATVCKYIVPEGYPVNSKAGEKIDLSALSLNPTAVPDPDPGSSSDQTRMYYGSVDKRDDGLYLSTSRALGFVGIHEDIVEAEKLAASALDSVKGPVFYRKDVGTQELIQKRVDMMKELRG